MGPTSAGDFAAVNGLRLYYETHGKGDPLILLHGGITASDCFGDNLAALARDRQVIAVHLQGHGFTADIDRPLRFESMADDIAALVRHLGLERVDVMGYSMGGGVAIQFAFRHPQLLRRLVVLAMELTRQGNYPEVIAAFDQMSEIAPMIAQGVQQSPLPAMYPGVDWETLFRKMGDLLRIDYDWTEGAAGIDAPTLLVFADADSIRPEHMVEFWRLLGGGQRDAGLDGSLRPVSRLAIVPGATHYSLASEPLVPGIVGAFLDQSGAGAA